MNNEFFDEDEVTGIHLMSVTMGTRASPSFLERKYGPGKWCWKLGVKCILGNLSLLASRRELFEPYLLSSVWCLCCRN